MKAHQPVKPSVFECVYVLPLLSHPEQIYAGVEAKLKLRIAEHNAGRVPHSSKFTPWE
jgi:putative endonuclease